jgi:hypothetical protein
MTATSSPLARPGFIYSLLLAIGMAAAVGTALGFQYIGGYIPCALCLLQRQPYYYAIPIGRDIRARRPAELDHPGAHSRGRHADAGDGRHGCLSRRRRMALLAGPGHLLDDGKQHDDQCRRSAW